MSKQILGFGLFSVSFLTSFSLYIFPSPIQPHVLAFGELFQKDAQASVVNAITPVVVEETVRAPILSVEKFDTFDPESLSWSSVGSEVPWGPRDSAATFVFHDRMWIMGGLNGNDAPTTKEHAVLYSDAEYFHDAWSSSNGDEWKLESKNIPWLPRRSMTVVPFHDALWMFGGWSPTKGYLNDVWRSEDGITWNRVSTTSPWTVREGHVAFEYKDKLWLMGGVDYDTRTLKNDVWSSSDGIVWEEVTSNATWSPRWDHAVAVYKDALYLAGGMNLKKDTFRDVWRSEDGLTWELLTKTPEWSSRQGHGLLVFHDLMWLVGRLNDDIGGGINDVWFSSDGIEWEKTTEDPVWIGREDHGTLVFDNALYVLGGMGSDWKWLNDVWRGE